mmetsp:Transcript_44770/g.112851  ORF Transcript_44770/g.112851 Transcript_44770/m.112851 type:complete len:671 (-) Transcript_44770:781-2793(-)
MGQVASSLPTDHAELVALFLAAGEQDDCQVIEEVSRRYAHNARILNARDKHGYTCLHRCVVLQNLECVRLLLRAPELDATIKTYQGLGVMASALRTGNRRIIDLLIQHNPMRMLDELTPQGGNAFHVAVEEAPEHLDLMVLHALPSAMNRQESEHKYSPLHLAVLRNLPAAVELLCERREQDQTMVRLQSGTRRGETALYLAAARGYLECVQILLRANAHPLATNEYGRTAMFAAAHYGHLRVFILLLEHAPEALNARDLYGNNAAHAFCAFLSRQADATRTEQSVQAADTVDDAAAVDQSERPAETGEEKLAVDQAERVAQTTEEPDAELYAQALSIEEADHALHLLLEHTDALQYKNKEGHSPLELLRRRSLDVRLKALRERESFALLSERFGAETKEKGDSCAPRLRIQVLSDVHLEFYANWEAGKRAAALDALLEPAADYVALLGDIGLVSEALYSAFLLRLASKFKGVYVLLGNHEYYRNTVRGTLDAALEVCELHPNLHLVQKHSFLLEGVRVLGTTLWSLVPESEQEVVSMCMTDYHRILDDTVEPTIRLSVATTNRWHREEVEFLRGELAAAKANDEPVLVLTHHSPLVGMGCSNPDFWGGHVHSAFGTDLRSLFGAPLHTWVYGHTHYYQDMHIAGTRVVSNAKGYPREDCPYDPRMVVEV